MARKENLNGQLSCSFCGKTQREVRKLIAGPAVYICDECVHLCTDIIREESVREESSSGPKALPTPEEIKTFLDQYVVGQDYSKKILSVAVYNHYKRIDLKNSDSKQGDLKEGETSESPDDHVELQKSNVLLVGPTGTGKTLLAQSLARFLDVPFTIADATTLTEAGYVGEDVETIVSNLLMAADNDKEKAERGIVYVDEIDKIARRGDSPSMARDVSGEGVQQALLKIIEGTRANISPRGSKKYGQSDMVQLDTTNILFICGGSFTGIESIIGRRTGSRGIGFGSELKEKQEKKIGEVLKDLRPEDLTKFGLIPEFVGRVPVISTLDELTADDLRHILTEPKNALVKQYKKLFALDRVELEFDDDAIDAMVEEAIKRDSGARGLRTILESAMLDIMYEVPYLEGIQSCRISRAVIEERGEPILTFKKKKSA